MHEARKIGFANIGFSQMIGGVEMYIDLLGTLLELETDDRA